jgi:hypothetical protein
MFSNIEAFGRQLLTSIYLIVCAIVAAQICFGYDKRKSREVFIVLSLFLILGIQYFYLIEVVSFVPATRFYVYDVKNPLLRS